MNIENDKISGRQLGRLVFYDYFALTTLLLPGILAKAVGMDGFFVLAAGCGAGFCLLLLVIAQIGQMRREGQDYHRYLSERFGRVLTVVILAVYLLTAIFGAAYGLRLLCDITRQYLIRETSAWLILAVLSALAVYGLCNGLESRGRMYEILFWFVLLPLVVLFFLAAQNVETDRFVPVFRAEGLQVLKNSYLVFSFLAGSTFLPMLTENASQHADVSRVLKQGFIFSVCVNLVLFLLLAGIFGVPTVATMEEAALTLTAMVKVPGGFLERQDALLCGIWLVSVFAFVENALYYAVWCMKKIGGKPVRRWYLPVAGLTVYGLAVCMYRSARLTSWLARIYARIGVPVLIGIVLVAWIMSVWKNRNVPGQDLPVPALGKDKNVSRRNDPLSVARKKRKSAERKNTTFLQEKSTCREEKR